MAASGIDAPLAAGTAAVAQSPIFGALDGNDAEIERLHQTLNRLEERLTPLCGDWNAPPTGPDSVQPFELSRVSGRIAQQGVMISGAINRVNDLLDRLEV